MIQLHPAYLYVGPSHKIKKACKEFIKGILCSQNTCNSCFTCRGVEDEQHYLVRWITPETGYTLATLDMIFKTLAFALNENEHLFFVLNQAELLTPACANSMLKSLEEPPRGYHFILLAERREGILPTISSRCILKAFDSSLGTDTYSLLPFFTSTQIQLAEFSKELERIKVGEWDMLDFLDQVYNYWTTALKESIKKQDKDKAGFASSVIELLDNARAYPPMPGSSKIFIRNLFLRYTALLI